MIDVYLSYKREDREKARVFADSIAARGLTVWWDIDLLPGDRFADEITAVLGQAVAAVVLWTESSSGSSWVRAEARLAQQRNILFPVKIGKCDLPIPFNEVHTADLSEWGGSSEAPEFILFIEMLSKFVKSKVSPRDTIGRSVQSQKLSEAEVRLWATISGSQPASVAEYRLYLIRHPSGLFVELAKLRIEELERRRPFQLSNIIKGVAAIVALVGALFGVITAFPGVVAVFVGGNDDRPTVVSLPNTSGQNPSSANFAQGQSNSIDILIVVDDSSSMAPEQEKFGSALADLLENLKNSYDDVRACIITTDYNYYNGAPIRWALKEGGTFVDQSVLLDWSADSIRRVVSDTIERLGSEWGSDEQAIRSTAELVRSHSQFGCIRQRGLLFVIVLSDEDERSTGGNSSLSNAQFKPFEEFNYPENLVALFRRVLPEKQLIWNSIVVVPGDKQCESQQDAQISPSFPGVTYAKLSRMTGGYIGSICEPDFSRHIIRFIEDISLTQER